VKGRTAPPDRLRPVSLNVAGTAETRAATTSSTASRRTARARTRARDVEPFGDNGLCSRVDSRAQVHSREPRRPVSSLRREGGRDGEGGAAQASNVERRSSGGPRGHVVRRLLVTWLLAICLLLIQQDEHESDGAA
jgi:hypothetical protein